MRPHSRRAGLAAALLSAMLALTLAGCAPPVRERASAPAAPPAEFPEGYYLEAATRGRPVFRVDSPESLVVIEVRRGRAPEGSRAERCDPAAPRPSRAAGAGAHPRRCPPGRGERAAPVRSDRF